MNDIQESLVQLPNDETLVNVGVILAVSFSFYITCVMMRRLWHRYLTRITVVADRVVRKHLSGMYMTMLCRIAAHKDWERMTASPFPTSRLGVATPATWESWVQRRVWQHVQCHNVQLLLPHEIDSIVFQCQQEVRRRMWFVRREDINEVVSRSCHQVYREYWTTLMRDYVRMLMWIRSSSG